MNDIAIQNLINEICENHGGIGSTLRFELDLDVLKKECSPAQFETLVRQIRTKQLEVIAELIDSAFALPTLERMRELIAPPVREEKRDLETDALTYLGKILPHPIPKDAVHLAVFSATAGIAMTRGGAHVGLRDGFVSPLIRPSVGIVDPFILGKISAGEVVQVMLYPNTITSVRHTWDHPNIDRNLHPKDENSND